MVQAASGATPIVPVAEIEQAALDAGTSASEAEAIGADYGDAQLQALKRAIGAVALFALAGLWVTRGLPGRQPSAASTGSERPV